MNTPPALALPPEAVPLLLLQRIDLQRVGATVNRSALGRLAYWSYEHSGLVQRLYRWHVLRGAAAVDREALGRRYGEMMGAEFAEITPHLPLRAAAVLDIGCGVGGLDVLLSRHYAQQGGAPQLYLVDKTEVSPRIYYGFHPSAAVYNSLAVTGELLAANGVDAAHVHLIDAADFAAQVPGGLDVALSLYAWGFHFPVDTYLDAVHERLRPGGVLILDVRRHSGGEERLRARFPDTTPVREYERSIRFRSVKAG